MDQGVAALPASFELGRVLEPPVDFDFHVVEPVKEPAVDAVLEDSLQAFDVLAEVEAAGPGFGG